MRFEDLSDFVHCYNPQNRHKRKPSWDEKDRPEGRWRSFSYGDLKAHDKTSLDIFWLKDKSLTDLDNLPEPDESRRRDHRELSKPASTAFVKFWLAWDRASSLW